MYQIEKRDPIDTEKIKGLKNNGLNNAAIAKKLGCTPGYISQYIKKETEKEGGKVPNQSKLSGDPVGKQDEDINELKKNIKNISDKAQEQVKTSSEYVLLAMKTIEILSEIWKKI